MFPCFPTPASPLSATLHAHPSRSWRNRHGGGCVVAAGQLRRRRRWEWRHRSIGHACVCVCAREPVVPHAQAGRWVWVYDGDALCWRGGSSPLGV